MATESDERKFWVSTYVTEEEFVELHRVGSDEGTNVSNVVKNAIEQFLLQRLTEERDPENTNTKLRLMILKFRDKKVKRAMAKQVAYEYLQDESDENAQLLRDVCELVGIDVEELMGEVSKNGNLAPLVNESKGKLKEAQIWLLDTMMPGVEVPARDIYEKAKRAGISKVTLDRAKAELNVSSERRSSNWVWLIPENGENGGEKAPF